jgi:two-component system, chemotaxis family, protein-glutamate methylesterase/glutaminase
MDTDPQSIAEKHTMTKKISVLVVDDSAFARLAITREIQAMDDITVIDRARDGAEAMDKIKLLHPDVVTLDVEMPNLDGLATLKRIMSECPIPVIMLSSLTGNGTDTTVRALEMGAVDFFLKHSLANPVGDTGDAIDLRTKINMASKVDISRRKRVVSSSPPTKIEKQLIKKQADKVIVIGSSTGGPRALYEVIPHIPADIPAAIIIVQHMPTGFTKSLADRLDQMSLISVKEAGSGDVLYTGSAYIAKGGYHLTVENGGILALNQNPPVCSVRPSVDVTMESAVKEYGRSTFAIVLTGMGTDGTKGSGLIKKAGGVVIAEDESTCVVWGMPRSVTENGYADRVVPLPQIIDEITRVLKERV